MERLSLISSSPLAFVLNTGALSSCAFLIFGFLPMAAVLVRAAECEPDGASFLVRVVNLLRMKM